MNSTLLKQYAPAIGIGIITGASVAVIFLEDPASRFTAFFGENILVSGAAFVMALILATVFAPLTTLPLVPAAAVLLGPFTTGVLAIIGWTLGALAAFLIARHGGRPLLSTFLPLERVIRYESILPKDAEFITIVALRMLLPVDVLSYALGLFSSISLRKYLLATALGVTYFSFVFPYLGSALHTGRHAVLFVLGGISLAILLIGWYALYRHFNR